jgi:6-phospho-3-hexuloisomerase
MAAARVAGPRDLLLASAGPGYFSTVAALSKEARRAGARVIILTSQPPTAAAVRELGDVVLQVPACCLPPSDEPAARQASEAPLGQPSPLLMGSSYELALQLFFDLVCVQLQGELGLSTEEMVERHTNLE